MINVSAPQTGCNSRQPAQQFPNMGKSCDAPNNSPMWETARVLLLALWAAWFRRAAAFAVAVQLGP
jgi:hypothetical protein